ncbi:hypothetical protein ILUMI_15965 [Ignelater luminosus]|uniref:Uncharacterized protein n=1 Tax=Ignelater luminosus TaxID=2038154 RepID=A0A8K0CT53_IGNLU|nr:hypothetical protein ILUMI_15965 [Ignelater luminosus]
MGQLGTGPDNFRHYKNEEKSQFLGNPKTFLNVTKKFGIISKIYLGPDLFIYFQIIRISPPLPEVSKGFNDWKHTGACSLEHENSLKRSVCLLDECLTTQMSNEMNYWRGAKKNRRSDKISGIKRSCIMESILD